MALALVISAHGLFFYRNYAFQMNTPRYFRNDGKLNLRMFRTRPASLRHDSLRGLGEASSTSTTMAG